MTTVLTPLKDLNVGDIIYADVLIDPADMADPQSQSTTAKKIRKHQPVTRLAVVFTTGTSSVEVTYLATFAHSQALPSTFTDKDLWYPIAPATKEGSYNPLPALSNDAQWASLRRTQTITKDPVKLISDPNFKLSAQSAGLIKAAMRA